VSEGRKESIIGKACVVADTVIVIISDKRALKNQLGEGNKCHKVVVASVDGVPFSVMVQTGSN
jgi:hypothetical protein